MRITIVMGFFLPVPPAVGGATEKTWHRLAIEFVRAGHEVTVISRRWENWPNDELVDGVRHLRLRGFNHCDNLPANLLLDFIWSLRVWFALPPADVTIVNCIALPTWLGWLRGRAGKLVVKPGRMPKGQFRLYRHLDQVLVVSNVVRDALLHENAALAPIMRLVGYPIEWKSLATTRATTATQSPCVTIGFIGRIHREKGLDLLTKATALLSQRTDLPSWKLLLCGPSDIAHGGSGEDYVQGISKQLSSAMPAGTWEIRPPVYDAAALVEVYAGLDIFCYPSLASRGETFGVAVAEAMAAGAVPVVSALPCFTDFVQNEINGLCFDHTAPDAPEKLANALARLIEDADLRRQLSTSARDSVQNYDFPRYAAGLLQGFSRLIETSVPISRQL